MTVSVHHRPFPPEDDYHFDDVFNLDDYYEVEEETGQFRLTYPRERDGNRQE